MQRVFLVVALSAIVTLAVLGGLWWRSRTNPLRLESRIAELTLATSAVANAENGKYREAMDGWSKLLAQHPNNRELLINQAITVLQWMSDANSRLSSGSVTETSEQNRLAKELQQAVSMSSSILEQLSRSSATESDRQSGTIAYLESSLLEAKAKNSAMPESLKLRKQSAQRLVKALKTDPAQPILATRLLELSQELGSDLPELESQASDALYQSWKANPRNLFLLVRAGENMIPGKDSRLAELLTASLDLAKPLVSMLGKSVDQIKPYETIPQLVSQIESGDWTRSARARQWFNVLRGSTAFRADARSVKPHLMALLDTRFLQTWRTEVQRGSSNSQIAASKEMESLEIKVPGDSKQPIIAGWYDFDVDTDFDVLAIRGDQLSLFEMKDRQLATTSLRTLSLPFSAQGFVLADLWDVDSPQRPRVPNRTVAEVAGSSNSSKNTEATQDSADNNAATKTITSTTESRSNRHDTLQEIIVWSEQSIAVVTTTFDGSPEDSPKLSIIDSVPGLSDVQQVREIVPIDFDSDGDLDLVVSTASGLRVLQNNGNRTFRDVSEYSQLPPAAWLPSHLVACDIDRDMDLDVVICSRTSPSIAVLENILHSQFRFSEFQPAQNANDAPDRANDPGVNDLVVGDFDSNASWDLVAVSSKSLGVHLTRTADSGVWNSESSEWLSYPADVVANRVVVADLNNDAYEDMCVATNSGVRIAMGNSLAQFAWESQDAVWLPGKDIRDVVAQDADQDGLIDLLCTTADSLTLLTAAQSSSSSPTNFVNVRVRGINDENGGGRMNHYSIGSVLELASEHTTQSRVILSPSTHFGLGKEKPLNLRIVFNNGLTQNLPSPSHNTLIEDIQELRGSCPFLYGWNGERFELVTDLLWNAPLGLQVARGNPLPDRRWEYLFVPGELMQPKDNAIEIHVTEELYEVAYFDQVELIAVDHPASVQLFTNEKVGPPSIAEPRLFTASRPIRPTQATDAHRRDHMANLSTRDRVFCQPFKSQICQGLCEPHFVELYFDKGELATAGDIRLVLNGWMFPTDTSLNIGLDQNPDLASPEPPSLWAPDQTGQFQSVSAFIGFPGGKPKSIVVDVTNLINRNDPRLRIAGSQQIYWDEAFLIVNEPPVPLLVQPLELDSAELAYRGFSQLMPRASDQPHWYDYHATATQPKWPPLDGPFTRFGDVRAELANDDDQMVVMTSGDDIKIRFRLPNTPVRSGWKRDYVLHSVGWDKDADANTLAGDGSLPLPFKTMSAYPPPPEQADEARRVLERNRPSLTDRSKFRSYWSRTKID